MIEQTYFRAAIHIPGHGVQGWAMLDGRPTPAPTMNC